MPAFASDSEYTLRWPPDLFAGEMRRLLRRGSQHGHTDEWEEEIALLLQQAFSSQVPAEDFRRVVSAQSVTSWSDDEPF